MPDKRIALVTGPNQGVGLQVAKELVANGVTVLVGSRNFERGEAAAKAALNAITLAMMVELDSTGIKVNLVSPGLTRTNLNGNPGTQSVEEGSREVLRVRCSARTAVGYVHALGRRDDTVVTVPSLRAPCTSTIGSPARAPAHRRGEAMIYDRRFMNPRPLLHLEGAAVLAVSVFACHSDHGSWGLFALLFLMPDVSMVGYLCRCTDRSGGLQCGPHLISNLYDWVRIQSRQIIGRPCCLR